MTVHDNAEFQGTIDVNGNDVKQAKFPRVDRDGYFIDEVRSNPTTGLLEIWDGTQWLGYIDTGTLPEGTVNQTLRHNGTEWVVSSILQLGTIVEGEGEEQSTRDIIKIPSMTASGDGEGYGLIAIDSNGELFNWGVPLPPPPPFDYIIDGNNNEELRTLGQQTIGRIKCYGIGSGSEKNEIRLTSNVAGKYSNGIYITTKEDQTDEIPTGISTISIENQWASLKIKNSMADATHLPFFISNSNSMLFYVQNNGRINSKYLSGATSSILEALPDGTIQRSTATMPAPQVNSDWNATEGVAQILNKPVIPQGESVNIETLTADKTLTASDATVQIYTSDANRIVELPTTGLTIGQKFMFVNNNNHTNVNYYEIRKNHILQIYLYSRANCTFVWNGTDWIPIDQYTNVSLGLNANGYDNGVALGRDSIGYTYGIALGYRANGSNYGVALGFDTDGKNSGTTLGSSSKGYTHGVAVGCAARGYTYGSALGYDAEGWSYGVAIGNRSKGKNYSVAIGSYAGYGQSIANRLYIHSSTATVGADSLIYGEFDNKIVRINNTLYVNDLVGTGDRPIVADSTGKLKAGTAISGNASIEYTSNTLSGTEHTFTGATLGITGVLRNRIKFIKVTAIDSDGNWNSGLIGSEFVYESDITINSTVDLSGTWKIKLYIEYI